MASPRGGGPLVQLVAFDKRQPADDGYGNTIAGPFVEQFQQRAVYIYLRGSEPVTATRLESRQALIVRIRNSAQSRQVGEDWQARDVHAGTLFNIRTITLDNSRAYLDLLVECGVATG